MMVGLSSSPRSAALIRRASRLAGRFDVHWFAVHVETSRGRPDRIDAATQRRLFAAQQLAAELGAEVRLVAGEHVAATLLDFAGAHGVAEIVVGFGPKWSWPFGRRRIASHLLAHIDRFNLHVLSTEAT